MQVHIHEDKLTLGRAAAEEGAAAIRKAISENGKAAIILATGASQFEMLQTLTQENIDWSKVTVFHLDEYIGLPAGHPASFRDYLQQRFVSQVSELAEFVAVDGSAADPMAEIARLNARIASEEIDLCFAGIGENCHLAFNDPPADFDIDAPYLIVTLDEACRRQQMGEGWFATLEDVPKQAISMSIRQIMKSESVVLSVPDMRKAQAVVDAVAGQVSNLHPASILQTHDAVSLHLDRASATLLSTGAV